MFHEVLYWRWLLWILYVQACVRISWEEAVWGTSCSYCFNQWHSFRDLLCLFIFLSPRVLLCRLPSLSLPPVLPSSRLISSVSFLQTPWCIFVSLKLLEISCTNELSLFSLGQTLCVHRGHSFTLPSGRPAVGSSPRGVLFEIPSLLSESRAPLWFVNHQSSSGDLVLS